MQVDWPAPANVKAVMTTRVGGASLGAYQSANLGTHVGDDPQHVLANRRQLALSIGVRPVFLDQVHGTLVAKIDASTLDGVLADGAVTQQPGVACTVMVADCLPLLLTNTDGTQVVAVHAGWRGLAAGVIDAALQTFADPQRVLAWLGPCIGPQRFEVGQEVREAFVHSNAEAAQYFVPQQNKWLAHLSGLARLRLLQLGVTALYGNDGGASWCTFSNPSVFFSHRRDRISGRMAATVWLV
jgi:polyphenol oxidase